MTVTSPQESMLQRARQRMIDSQLRRRGISDPRVLAAMATVPREHFVTPSTISVAYEDTALPITHGQTISQPYIVAFMAETLELGPRDTVLEIGTGTGYAAAVLSLIVNRVYTIERVPELCESARERLRALGYGGVEVRCGDGTLGWPEHAPYQGITCAASGPAAPRSLLAQLDIGGKLVMPIDTAYGQKLMRFKREGRDDYATVDLGVVHFVPLIGEEAWPA